MHFLRGAILVGVSLLLVGTCFGSEVYFRDGTILQCASFRTKGDAVIVQLNRDAVLSFERKEIDLRRTFGRIARKRKVAVKSAAAGHAQAPERVTKTAADQAAAPPAPVQASAVAPASTPAPAAAAPTAPAPAEKVEAVPAPPAPVQAPQAEPQLPKNGMEPQPKTGSPSPASMQLGATTILALLGFVLIAVASLWRVFVKAGQSGVSSLIPIYNLFVFMEISGKPWWWLFLVFIPVVGAVFTILANVSLAGKFGKGLVFGLGLSFLPMIFLPLLAFGSAEYEG